MTVASYKICPICGCKLLPERYDQHMETQHSAEAELKRELIQQEIEEIRKQKEIEGEEIIQCEICHIEIKRKNLNKHNYHVHKKKKL